jgi:maltose alpha-D-glucosyltransferase/alpha-amylase
MWLVPERPTNHDDHLWYKDAIIYQVHLKSFFDSNDDGVGDFRGLLQKLDYLEGLGITAMWLLPFYPSPLKDDGYDIADYFRINPDYGSPRDFRRFLKEAHRRGIRVITELVINHTSSDHPWFQRARRAKPGSIWRDYYVWSDTPDKYKDARIIFKDFEASNWTYDAVAGAYFWHRFYAHQPDLNFDNPRVQREIFRVVDFWAELGVDGFRLDAIPYLYEREGTNCENLPESHEFLKKLRAHFERKFKGRMFLAEANQWPEDAAAYFGDGDECHMAFHFPVMPRMFMAVRMEDRFPIVDILEQTPRIADGCQWATFLRNHDELTLEMVTDEERDYMYNVYAKDPRARINLGIRRRLAPLLDNNRRKVELMNMLFFSLPGTPVIYYGDEIGMGDNYYLGDRNGVRTPMQWSADRNAGFSKANPQKLYLPVIIDPEYNYEAINVENQERNLSSLLWWMKRVIATRKRFKAFSRGELEFVHPENPKVLAFTRRYEDEILLVVINLSRFSQVIDLDLSRFAGYVPEEVFSHNKFPMIRETLYPLTLGPHGHFWFALESEREGLGVVEQRAAPEITVSGHWTTIFKGALKMDLEKRILPDYVSKAAWFDGIEQRVQKIDIQAMIPIPKENPVGCLLMLAVESASGASDSYLLPLAFAPAADTANVPAESILAILSGNKGGVLFDGIYAEEFRRHLLSLINKKKRIAGPWGELVANQGKRFGKVPDSNNLPSRVLKGGQGDSMLLFGDVLLLKLYRKIHDRFNPDLEMVKFLTEARKFANIPHYAGNLELQRSASDSCVFAMLQGFVPHEADAWSITVDLLGRYFERVLARRKELEETQLKSLSIFEVSLPEVPALLQDLIGGVFLDRAALLGQRTAEMHLALADSEHPNFAPEPFSKLYLRALYQSMRADAIKRFRTFAQNLHRLPPELKNSAETLLAQEKGIINTFQKLTERKISAMKIRIHGDFHLAKVLFTGKDFVIFDFEGEPGRSTGERRLRYPSFRDVAGMIRSFHYAGYSALFNSGVFRPEDMAFLQSWVEPWYCYVSGVFFNSYLHAAGQSPIIPQEKEEREILLQSYLLSKAIFELAYEVNHRPQWAVIPIAGINSLIG